MQTLPDWMPALAIILAGRVQKGALESGSWDAKVIVVSVGPVSMMHNGACGVLGCLRSSETDVRVLAIQASKYQFGLARICACCYPNKTPLHELGQASGGLVTINKPRSVEKETNQALVCFLLICNLQNLNCES